MSQLMASAARARTSRTSQPPRLTPRTVVVPYGKAGVKAAAREARAEARQRACRNMAGRWGYDALGKWRQAVLYQDTCMQEVFQVCVGHQTSSPWKRSRRVIKGAVGVLHK
jgi:hypothetical protein